MAERAHYYEGETLFLRCSRCKEFKETVLFNKNKKKPFGFDCYCKECNSIIAKQKYHKDVESSREKKRVYSKKYKQKHREKINKLQRERYSTEKAREYQRRYREKHYEIWRKRNNASRKKIFTEGRRPNRERDKKKSAECGFNIATFHAKATSYIKKNGLRPDECMMCGVQGYIEFHHPSYESKEDRCIGIFLCRSCHNKCHTGELQCPEPVDLIQLNAHMPKILSDKDLENVYEEGGFY